MSGDPARRPSNARIRVVGDIGEVVWVECASCLGDGWHYPTIGNVDRLRRSTKYTCTTCGGRGAREVPRLLCEPDARIVAGPRVAGSRVGDPSGGLSNDTGEAER